MESPNTMKLPDLNIRAQRWQLERFLAKAGMHFMLTEGWLTLSEAYILFALAEDLLKTEPQPVVVEIGSHLGKSTGIIASAFGKHGGSVYAVDPWDSRAASTEKGKEAQYTTEDRYPTFCFNVAGLPVTPLQGMSADHAPSFDDASVDMLFIDGNHTEAGVTLDLDLWCPKLKPNGILTMHDVFNPDRTKAEGYERGPWQAIVKRIADNPQWSQASAQVDTLFITRKV